MPDTSAIILTYSRPDLVPDIVNRLRPQGCEIIVADDGLPRDVAHALDGLGVKRYALPDTGQRLRQSTCRNEAAKLATGRYLLFLDDDCLPAPDVVAQHERALVHYDVSIGLEVEDWQNKASDTRLHAFEHESAPTSWMTHAGHLALRRDAFWQVGGFDDRTFDGQYAWEDTDLGVRLEIAGRTFYLNHDAVALHVGVPADKRDPARSAANFARFDAKRKGAKRIFFIYSGHMVSTYDVGRGWDRALRQAGHIIKPFRYHDRIQFYNVADRAWKAETGREMGIANLVRLASEGAIAEAIEFRPDIAVIICGLVLDRMLLTTFYALGIPTVLIMTESPYSDDQQSALVPMCDLVFTNDRSSLARLRRYNARTHYLPHSHDPWVHYPQDGGAAYEHDVFFFGTLYPERKAMFRNPTAWAGTASSISGTHILDGGDIVVSAAIGSTPGRLWLPATRAARAIDRLAGTRLDEQWQARHSLVTWQPNTELAKHYSGAKISLSWHRTTADYFRGTVIGQDAYSLGPRGFEIPACGGFMLSDATRPELREVYGDAVPTYSDASSLEREVRYWLSHDEERQARARAQRRAVAPCSFRDRLETILWPEVTQWQR